MANATFSSPSPSIHINFSKSYYQNLDLNLKFVKMLKIFKGPYEFVNVLSNALSILLIIILYKIREKYVTVKDCNIMNDI